MGFSRRKAWSQVWLYGLKPRDEKVSLLSVWAADDHGMVVADPEIVGGHCGLSSGSAASALKSLSKDGILRESGVTGAKRLPVYELFGLGADLRPLNTTIIPRLRGNRRWLPEERWMILSKSDGRCWYCGGDLYLNQITTRDHFLPKSAGGSDDLGNLVPCCSQCNHAKGDRMLEEYRLRLQLSKEAEGHEFWFETTDSLGRCLARPVAV